MYDYGKTGHNHFNLSVYENELYVNCFLIYDFLNIL